MMLSPPSAKKLSSMPTRSSPSTSANSAHSISSCGVRGARRRSLGASSGAGSARRSSLPFGVSGKPLQHHERRRHHVVRQALPPTCARSAAASAARAGAPPPHSRPAACSPAASSRAITAACATAGCRSSAASISPGSMRKPRSFTCASARPEELQHPVRAPARQVAGAVHPAARRPERVGHEPLRRQPGAPEIAARQPRARDVKLARNARRHRLQAAVQHVNPRVPDRPANRNVTRAVVADRPSGSRRWPLRSAVQVVELERRAAAAILDRRSSARQRLAAADEHGGCPDSAAPARRARNACSIEGTKCSVVTPCLRIVSTSRAGSRCAPGAASTRRAPVISGQKNSQTETSKLNGVFCSTTSSARQPIRALHPAASDCADRDGCWRRPSGCRSSPRCRSRRPGARDASSTRRRASPARRVVSSGIEPGCIARRPGPASCAAQRAVREQHRQRPHPPA